MAMPDILTNKTFKEGIDALKKAIEKGIGNADLFKKVGNTEIKYGEGDCSTAINDLGERLDEGEVYSTEEQVIGTWLGKPLYVKSFEKNVSATGTDNVDVLIATIPNITPIKTYGTYERGSYIFDMPSSYYSSSGHYETSRIVYAKTTGNITLQCCTKVSTTITKIWLTIYYTKTTD